VRGSSSGVVPMGEGKAIWLVLLAALSVCVCYADRSNMAVATVNMAEEFSWTRGQEGAVLSSFFLGYALTQIAGGWLADRFGGGKVLAGGVTLWSLCTLLTPSAASLGVPSLLLMRTMMGVGEGPAFPAIHSMISRGVGREARSTAVGVVTAASYIGSFGALSISPVLIQQYEWPSVFYVFGVAGLLWLPAWAAFYFAGGTPPPPPSTETISGSSPGSLGEGEDATTGGLIRRLGSEKGVWGIIAAQYTQSWGLYGMLSWLPTLISERYGIATSDLGSFTVAPYVVQGVVGLGAGVVADRLMSTGMRAKTTRQIMQGAGMVGPAALLLGASSPSNSVDQATLLITLGLGLSALTLGGVSAAHLDLSRRHSGIIFGMGNTAGTLGGFVSTYACGALQEATQSWGSVLVVIAAHYLVGALLFHIWVDDTPLEY